MALRRRRLTFILITWVHHGVRGGGGYRITFLGIKMFTILRTNKRDVSQAPCSRLNVLFDESKNWFENFQKYQTEIWGEERLIFFLI